MNAESIPAGTVLHLLTGPTAVGKTETALQWAEANDAEIVSADSLLFYRGMDIGTAKPTPAERARVPHHLIDVTPVNHPWDIRRFVGEAASAVAGIAHRGRKVLVTGGSGFYLKSFWAPVVDECPARPELRARIDRMEREEPETMLEELRRLNPEGLGELDTRNPRRVARALERCLASGLSLAALQARMRSAAFPCKGLPLKLVLLQREPESLRQRVSQRVDQMLAAGLVDEVKHLAHEGLEENPSAASAIGYRETLRFLRGEMDRAGLREEIIRNTNRLIRKQGTWFRHQLPHHRVITMGQTNLSVESLFE